MKSWDQLKDEVCEILIRMGAIKFGTFTLSSGALSPYYIDLRLVPSDPAAMRRICHAYTKFIEGEVGLDSFDRICAIPTAGMAFAAVVAYELGKPFLYVRREAKSYGRERRVEGLLNPGDKVLIIDDLITTGNSIAAGVDAMRAEGGVVEDVVVLIDREEGGADKLRKMGVRLRALMGITEVAKRLLDLEVLDPEQYSLIIKQVRSKRRDLLRE